MSVDSTVVVVEDDDDDFFLTQRALRRYTNGKIIHLENGRAALDYLAGGGVYADRQAYPPPGIVFLDLKMDHVSGHDVLAAVRQNPPDPLPKIFVLTGSNEPKDREMVKSSGVAAGYIVKPLASEHLQAIFGPAIR
jgi:two-component system, response regulator